MLVALILAVLPLTLNFAGETAGSLPFRVIAPELDAPTEVFAAQSRTSASRALNAEAEQLGAAIEAQERHTDALLRHPGVLGTAVALNAQGDPVVRIYLRESAAAGDLPGNVDGIPVEVEFTGPLYALNVACEQRDDQACDPRSSASTSGGAAPQQYQSRPVPIGVSSGHTDVTAGTLACRVSRGCHSYALSNAHVFAAENDGQPGDPILQPGVYDGGINPDDAIGSLAETIPITMTTTAKNRVDAAIAMVSPAMLSNATPSAGYGAPRADTLNPWVGLNVMKFGRTTSLTYGYIDAINATVLVSYQSGDARFVGQIIIKPEIGADFSRPGDSGSLVVASGGSIARKPVGLLFASGTGISIANPINDVLSQLDIDIDGDY